ncbi:MAG: hypothetical protein FWF06_03135 [Symbiobacteriaceae bacterium]|nr:hypothetical protein [Symbiobacteriaceae bacterium]
MQTITKLRTLPAPGTILVNPGDLVAPGSIIANLEYVPGALQRVEVARALGLAAPLLADKMQLKVGDSINKGDILAASTEFFYTKEVPSPIDGYVAVISPHQGSVYLRSRAQHSEDSKPIIISATKLQISLEEFLEEFLPIRQEVARSGQGFAGDGRIVVMAGQRLFKSKELLAPYTCLITTISLEEGYVEMIPLHEINQLKAMIHGVVTAIPEQGVCQISSYGYRYQGTVGYGDVASGTLQVSAEATHDLQVHDITAHMAEKILVAPQGATLAALQQMAEVGIAGVMLGHLDFDVLEAFSNQNPLRYLGQLMLLPFPIILFRGLEGAIPAPILQEMISHQGRMVLLDANTQMRVGVSRPELVVPIPESFEAMEQEAAGEQRQAIAIGDLVTVQREPYYGQQGFVWHIGSHLQETSAGTKAVLATLRLLPSEEEVHLPLVNITRLIREGKEGA